MTEIPTVAFGSGIPVGKHRVVRFRVDGRRRRVADKVRRGSDTEPIAGTQEAAILRTGPRDLNELEHIWPPRWQGRYRGTCTAFAVVAALEFEDLDPSHSTPPEDLSEEFLYRKMRKDYPYARADEVKGYDKYGATVMEQAAVALAKEGVCAEALMPYRPDEVDPAFNHEPTRGAEIDAETRMIPEHEFTVHIFPPEKGRPDMDIAKTVREQVERGRAVSIALPVYPRRQGRNNWTVPGAYNSGVIPDPKETNPRDHEPVGGHAVCVVGFRPDEDNRNEGWFVFRNSWGRKFARDFSYLGVRDKRRPPGRGYGTISTKHVRDHCWELMYRSG